MKKGRYAPVVVFAYKRVDKLMKCIDSLTAADLHEKTEVYIYADGAKGKEDEEDVGKVRRYLKDILKNHDFGELKVVERNRNVGLANNVISGVSEVIHGHNRIIAVEDDLIVTGDFLDYINKALDYYETEENVWSVTGFSEPLGSLKKYKHDVYYGYRGCSYGWGTWKDRWESVDWEVKDYSFLLSSRKLQKHFNRGGNDMTGMLVNQMEGRIDSWAIRWCFAQSMQNKYTVYPVSSFIVNDGVDGTGTNQHKGEAIRYNMHEYGEKMIFEKLKPDKRITRDFYYAHSDTLAKKIKRNIPVLNKKIQINPQK